MTPGDQIRIKGLFDPRLAAWFGDLAIAHTPEGDTLLIVSVLDQAALLPTEPQATSPPVRGL